MRLNLLVVTIFLATVLVQENEGSKMGKTVGRIVSKMGNRTPKGLSRSAAAQNRWSKSGIVSRFLYRAGKEYLKEKLRNRFRDLKFDKGPEDYCSVENMIKISCKFPVVDEEFVFSNVLRWIPKIEDVIQLLETIQEFRERDGCKYCLYGEGYNEFVYADTLEEMLQYLQRVLRYKKREHFTQVDGLPEWIQQKQVVLEYQDPPIDSNSEK